MNDCMSTLREQIYSFMNKKNWSITLTSDFCGISRNELSKILSGKHDNIQMSTLLKISEATEIPIESLICKRFPEEEKGMKLLKKIYTDISSLMKGVGV